MHYALYRKYRPLLFEDVVGQDAVTVTLRRQVSSGQISHAYLFTGTRGTGKTTCAKILARAVNCLHPHDGDPCNECEICRGLLDGTLYDVEEIDAASNNGVENIRQIREEVVYAPAAAKYKVYIIDEVHMLSSGAFNALLKTLEEPPSHAVFILATTEIHKVPATILSRCQRFDFLRLSKKALIGQFRSILTAEGKSLDEESLDLVAELADGSSRDGLSILDKVLDLETFDRVEAVLGVIPKRQTYELLEAIARQDTETLYRSVEAMYNASGDLGRLCSSLMDTMKDLMICRSVRNPENILEKSEGDLARLKELAERFPLDRILYSLSVLQDTSALLPRSFDKRADTEVCMLRLAQPSLKSDSQALAARVSVLEQKLEEALRSGTSVPTPAAAAPAPVPTVPPPASVSSEKPVSAKRSVPVFDDPFENPSVTSAKAYREPEGAPVPASVPAVPPPPPVRRPVPRPAVSASNNVGFVEGWQPLAAWDDIAHSVGRQDRILGYLLESTSAVYQGHNILILAEDPEDYAELKTPKCIQLVQDALKENRKEGYSIRIEHCSPDRYIHNATVDSLQKNNLFDFGDEDGDLET